MTHNLSTGELCQYRPVSLAMFFRRYVIGDPTEQPYTKGKLRERLKWDDSATEVNSRRIAMMETELAANMEGLREQFQKVARIIALFAIMIGFNMTLGAKSAIINVVCTAAILALWVQSPRFKIFRFRKRSDAGIRIGEVMTQFDEFYYYYVWVVRREQTLHASEVLVHNVTIAAMVALAYVAIAT